MKIRYFILLITLLGFSPSYADGDPEQLFSSRFLVQFSVNKSEIDISYKDNYYALQELQRFFNTIDLSKVDSITVIGSSSPEGKESSNLALAMRRAQSMRRYLFTTFEDIPRDKVQLYAKGDTWADMLKLIRSDENFPRKDETLVVLEAERSYKSRVWLLQFLEYQESAKYIQSVVLPQLRNAMVIMIRYKSKEQFVVYDTKKEYVSNQKFISPPSGAQPLMNSKQAPKMDDMIEKPSYYTINADNYKIRTTTTQDDLKIRKPLFALKTNLLFDAATLLNAEIEIPLAKRWSIAAEFIFPWWLNENKQNAIQMYNANLEVRYWFAPRDNQPKGLFSNMTGWFVGVYGGGGIYDIEYKAKGYQGEFFIAGGLSGGYAHSIGKSLRMEYSIGVGYMITNYRRYEVRFAEIDNSWHLYRQETGRFTWIGPTRAKISLVWMLNRNVRKGGSR